MRQRNKSLWIGIILVVVGVVGYYYLSFGCTYANGCASKLMTMPTLYAFLPFILILIIVIGAFILVAHFKSWLARSVR